MIWLACQKQAWSTIPEDHDIYQEYERQKLLRVIMFHILGIQNLTQSDHLQFWSDWGDRGSQFRHPCECEGLGANQLWAGEDKPSEGPEGHYRDLPAHVTRLVICLCGLTVNKLINWDHQVRWKRQNKAGFTIGTTGKLSNEVGNMLIEVLVLKI